MDKTFFWAIQQTKEKEKKYISENYSIVYSVMGFVPIKVNKISEKQLIFDFSMARHASSEVTLHANIIAMLCLKISASLKKSSFFTAVFVPMVWRWNVRRVGSTLRAKSTDSVALKRWRSSNIDAVTEKKRAKDSFNRDFFKPVDWGRFVSLSNFWGP